MLFYAQAQETCWRCVRAVVLRLCVACLCQTQMCNQIYKKTILTLVLSVKICEFWGTKRRDSLKRVGAFLRRIHGVETEGFMGCKHVRGEIETN